MINNRGFAQPALSFMLQLQLQIRMKLTVLRLLLKRILLLIQITVLIMRIMRIIPIYFQGGSISGGSTFKDGSVFMGFPLKLIRNMHKMRSGRTSSNSSSRI